MKKRIVILAVVLIILIITITITILIINNNQEENISDYELSRNLNQEYKYYFNRSDTPLIYYIDKEKNCMYIRICTYKYGIRPKIDNQKDEISANLIKEICCNKNGNAKITLNEENFEKFNAIEYMEDGPYTAVLADEVEFYIKINNVKFNSIELVTEKNNEVFYPNKTYTLEQIAKENEKEFNNRYPYYEVKGNGKYGLIDKNGNMILDFISIEKIKFSDMFDENDNLKFIIKKDDNLLYLVNSNGTVVGDGYEWMSFYRSGKGAIVKKDNKKGAIDINGVLIVPMEYNNVEILNYSQPDVEIFQCTKDDFYTTLKFHLVNKNGKDIYQAECANIFNNEPILILVENDGKKYVIDENGIVKMKGIDREYDYYTKTFYIKIIDENAMIYDVKVNELFNDKFTIELITTDKIVLKDKEKSITIQNGSIVN